MLLDLQSLIFIGGVLLFCLIIYLLAQDPKSPKVIVSDKKISENKIKVTQTDIFNTTKRIAEKVKYGFTPREFEIFCALIFKELGYEVKLTSARNDGGKDLVLNNSIVVECKKYSKQVVGREICQKLLGAMLQMKADKAIIINTGEYNLNAKTIEREVEQLILIDFNGIIKLLDKIGIDKSNEILKKTKKI